MTLEELTILLQKAAAENGELRVTSVEIGLQDGGEILDFMKSKRHAKDKIILYLNPKDDPKFEYEVEERKK